jgi:hypothetical protein
MASKTTTQNVIQTTSNIGAAQQPYYNTLMQGAQGLLRTNMPIYQGGDRLEGFTQQQKNLQNQIAGMQTPGQFGTGSQLATTAGLGALQAGQYNAGQFNSQQIGMPNLQQYSMQGPRNVYAQQYSTPQMQAAQTGFKPNLNYFQMQQPGNVQGSNVQSQDMQAAQTTYGQGPLEQFRMDAPQQFGGVQAQQYMSPFAESVMEPQKREAIRSAKQSQLVQDLGAARQGTYGGSRQLLAGLERERNLGQQLGDIDARGRQAAFENAQQQFERDRAAGMTAGRENLQAALGQQQLGVTTGLQSALANLDKEQQARVNNQAQQFQAQGMNAEQSMRAALANQQAGLTTGQQNLSANLQTQQLATDTDLRASLANLDAASQANVQNLAAQLQQQGLNQQQAMQAALANQQAQLTTGQQNLQAALDTQRLGAQTGLAALQSNQQSDLERQRMAEQSRQFGAQQGLAGLAQANQSAQTLTNLGLAQQQADLSRYGLQTSTAAQQQALGQQQRDLDYQDFLREVDYPYMQYQRYANLMSGVPQATQTTRTESAPAPGVGQTLLGGGLAAAGIYNTFRGG